MPASGRHYQDARFTTAGHGPALPGSAVPSAVRRERPGAIGIRGAIGSAGPCPAAFDQRAAVACVVNWRFTQSSIRRFSKRSGSLSLRSPMLCR